MAAQPEIHEGDVGTKLRVLVQRDGVVFNVSVANGNTVKTIKLRDKDGTVKVKTASYGDEPGDAGDGTDGILQYTTLDSDLDSSGPWDIQAYVEHGTSVKFHTSQTAFPVLPNL